MGMLYVVPTPVGNMEDMTFRAIRILKEADLILAEDTRTSGILLKHYEIKNQLMSHHKFNEHGTSQVPRLSCPHWWPADCPTTGSALRASCRRRKVVRHVWRIYAMRSVRWCSMNRPTGW